jgi:hypothetical protein
VRCLGIALAPCTTPPGDDRFHRERGGMGGAGHDRAPIGWEIIEATGDGDPLGLRPILRASLIALSEAVIQHCPTTCNPTHATASERFQYGSVESLRTTVTSTWVPKAACISGMVTARRR